MLPQCLPSTLNPRLTAVQTTSHIRTPREPAPGCQHYPSEEQVPPTAPGCAATHPSPLSRLSHRHCCCSRVGWKKHKFVLETFSFWRKQHSKSQSFLIFGEAWLTHLGTSCTFSQAFVLHYLIFSKNVTFGARLIFSPFPSKG